MRRATRKSWTAFLEFLAAEIVHPGLAAVVKRFFSDDSIAASLRRYCLRRRHTTRTPAGCSNTTVGVATLCRETAQLHPRLRSDLLLAAALLHDIGRVAELTSGPTFRQTDEGRLWVTSISACDWSRNAAPHSRQSRVQSSCMRSRATTTHALPAPPKRPFCTTRINLTRSAETRPVPHS